MTSIDTWPPWIAIIVTGGPILLAAAGITFSLYLSRRHLDSMKDALKNSRFIYIWGTSLGRRGGNLVASGNIKNCRNGDVTEGVYSDRRIGPCRF